MDIFLLLALIAICSFPQFLSTSVFSPLLLCRQVSLLCLTTASQRDPRFAVLPPWVSFVMGASGLSPPIEIVSCRRLRNSSGPDPLFFDPEPAFSVSF